MIITQTLTALNNPANKIIKCLNLFLINSLDSFFLKPATRKNKKIESILVFFNNNRGLKLSKFLTKKKFKIYEVVTKKFLNKKILKKLSKNSRVISNLKSKNLKKFIEKKKFDLIISAGFPHIFQKDFK